MAAIASPAKRTTPSARNGRTIAWSSRGMPVLVGGKMAVGVAPVRLQLGQALAPVVELGRAVARATQARVGERADVGIGRGPGVGLDERDRGPAVGEAVEHVAGDVAGQPRRS